MDKKAEAYAAMLDACRKGVPYVRTLGEVTAQHGRDAVAQLIFGVVIWSGSNRSIIVWKSDHANPIEHYAGGTLDTITLANLTPPAPAGTVPVRIAVAANDKREWRVRGANDLDDWTMRYHAADALDGDCLITFITAHVPLPQPPAEVAGVVEGAEKC